MILDVPTVADRPDAAAEGNARLTAVDGAVLGAVSRIGPDWR
jgi:hypothetical protein